VAEFYKGYWRKNYMEGGERVGVVTMTEKRSSSFEDED